MAKKKSQDERYFRLIQEVLSVCRNYKPKFGKGQKGGLSLSEFQSLYQDDPFYTWFGLDSPLLYTAHKAAGGMTSVYRQIGISCERLFRQLLQDTLRLLSNQIDDDIAERCTRAQWVILRGALKGSPLESTYAFSREVLDYDLAAFFERNSLRIRKEIESITEALLQ